MDAAKQWTFTLERFVAFCRDVIDPAIYSKPIPLDTAIFQSPEPIPFAEAVRAKFKPVAIGHTWGPRWSTAWFHIRGRVPRAMNGERVVLRFSTDTEALLWKPTSRTNAVPLHGLDANRDAVTLFEQARGGEQVNLYVEAACNHLFGDRGLQWDPPEIHRRWNSATPGLFERCELAVLSEPVWRLKWMYTFALDLARQLPPDSARAAQLLSALRAVTNMIPDDAVASAAPRAIKELGRAIGRDAGGSATLCHAIGHAHIDTAWLWPIRETKRKLHRTFSSALRNMERSADFTFLCSQAQQYEWVEKSSPELFAQIKKRVAEGRWEPGGAMWVEPDCTCPSGESLIRQILHANRYWREKFGNTRGRQRFLYLPDTFGFPAQLPQIMKLAGLDTFITNKLHWNSHTVFPHTTFLWRGLDGSEVLAHNTPGMDYNATMTPRELIRGEKTHKNKDLMGPTGTARWLQPFGFGDGGGGPTDWNILNAQLAENCDTLPRVKFSTVSKFCDDLHADLRHARKHDPHAIPTHDGELYLELHRGTYTTHARIKQHNAECEELLRQAEILTFAGPTRLPAKQEQAAKAELDRAWKLLLLNQFHDILPGSSIGWVYEDAERDYATIREIAAPLIDAGMLHWAKGLSTTNLSDPVAVFNLSNGSLGAFDESEGQVFATHVAAPLSVRIVDRACRTTTYAEMDLDKAHLLSRKGLRFSHKWLEVEFDRQGRITELTRKYENGRVRASIGGPESKPGSSPVNQFELYEDRPRLWDAWDVDPEYVQKRTLLDGPCECTIVQDTPERAVIRFSRTFGRGSRVTQDFSLFATSCSVLVDTEVDWREEHRMLCVSFPVGASRPRLGTQFGWRYAPQSVAAFEVPFQRFIADNDSGLCLVFPDKYGASVRDGTIGVSLLRSSRYPDPKADIGTHRFRYAILAEPHASPWGSELDAVLRPSRVLPIKRNSQSAGKPKGWVLLETGLCVEAVKRAEDDDRLIVRLVNGDRSIARMPIRWNFPVKSVQPVDLLERPTPLRGFRHDAKRKLTTFAVDPFQIITLAITRAD